MSDWQFWQAIGHWQKSKIWNKIHLESMPMFDTIISFSMLFFVSLFLSISCYKLLYIRYTSVVSNYVQGTFLLKFNNYAMCISQEANALSLTLSHKFTEINLDSFGKGDFSVSNLTSNDTLPHILCLIK